MLASICVQAMRYPVYEGLEIALNAISSRSTKERQAAYDHVGASRTRHISGLLASLLYDSSSLCLEYLMLTHLDHSRAVTLHTSFHEALRVFTLYLINPLFYSQDQLYSTTTQLFQQSYHLGLGWGIAEAFWGIAKGWFAGMRLYVDVLPWSRRAEATSHNPDKNAPASGAFRDTDTSLEEAERGLGDESGRARQVESRVAPHMVTANCALFA